MIFALQFTAQAAKLVAASLAYGLGMPLLLGLRAALIWWQESRCRRAPTNPSTGAEAL